MNTADVLLPSECMVIGKDVPNGTFMCGSCRGDVTNPLPFFADRQFIQCPHCLTTLMFTVESNGEEPCLCQHLYKIGHQRAGKSWTCDIQKEILEAWRGDNLRRHGTNSTASFWFEEASAFSSTAWEAEKARFRYRK